MKTSGVDGVNGESVRDYLTPQVRSGNWVKRRIISIWGKIAVPPEDKEWARPWLGQVGGGGGTSLLATPEATCYQEAG